MSLLNLEEKSLDRPVYRVFPLGRALDLISENRLVLVSPKSWDDIYENLLLKDTQRKHDPKSGFVMRWYGNDLYASCWSWIPESDFGWRVYVPPDEHGVIVKTTVRKLYAAVNKWGGLFRGRDCFIGQVHYMLGGEILAYVRSPNFQQSNASSDTAHMLAWNLLLKRIEFEHEREVRVIVECADPRKLRESKLVDVAIDPHDLIDELIVDPRMDATEFDIASKALRDAGYSGNIRQSEFYRLPWDENTREE